MRRAIYVTAIFLVLLLCCGESFAQGKVAKSDFHDNELVSKLLEEKIIEDLPDNPDLVQFDESIKSEDQLKRHLEQIGIKDKEPVLTLWRKSSQTTTPPTEKPEHRKRLLVLPYPFFNETIGFGGGIGFIADGYLQRRVKSVGTVFGSDNGTVYFFTKIVNLQVPLLERVFFEPQVFVGQIGEIDVFVDGNEDFPDETSGSNESNKDNFIEAEGTDQSYELNLKLLLPLGHGNDHIFPEYKLDNGVLVSGASGGEQWWNPLNTGRTYFQVIPFYREQDFENDEDALQRTSGLEGSFIYDNTDFPANPSKGSYQEVAYRHDWGSLDSSAQWQVMEIDYQKYFSLGPTESARQRVIAFNLWTVESFKWNSFNTDSDGEKIFHRPPTYQGASLGGLHRLRGYPTTRFHDRAALYYALEYRHILDWNPLKDATLGGRLDIDWIQLVGFGELGRVAPAWNLKTFHEDMKWDIGAGVRVMLNQVVVRLDVAYSDEEIGVQVFFNHPF
jgi:hypothetical protein